MSNPTEPAIDPELDRRLQELGARTGREPAALIREAVAAYLARADAERQLPSWVGSWRPAPAARSA